VTTSCWQKCKNSLKTKTYENEILVHWSKEMWITKKIRRKKHIEKLVKFVKAKFEI